MRIVQHEHTWKLGPGESSFRVHPTLALKRLASAVAKILTAVLAVSLRGFLWNSSQVMFRRKKRYALVAHSHFQLFDEREPHIMTSTYRPFRRNLSRTPSATELQPIYATHSVLVPTQFLAPVHLIQRRREESARPGIGIEQQPVARGSVGVLGILDRAGKRIGSR